MLWYDSTGTASPLAGQGHTNLVSGLASSPDGNVFSTGYDDRVREVEGSHFTYIVSFLLISDDDNGKLNPNNNNTILYYTSRSSVFSTASQPKTLAVGEDSTIFVVGVDTVEAIRNHQKVADLRPWGDATNPTAIAATGSLVAIGFGVSPRMSGGRALLTLSSFITTVNLFFFWVPSWYIGSEGSALRLGWQDAPGGWPVELQRWPREYPRVFARWLEARCGRRKYPFLPSTPTQRRTPPHTTVLSHGRRAVLLCFFCIYPFFSH